MEESNDERTSGVYPNGVDGPDATITRRLIFPLSEPTR